MSLAQSKGKLRIIETVEDATMWKLKYNEFIFPSLFECERSLPALAEAGIVKVDTICPCINGVYNVMFSTEETISYYTNGAYPNMEADMVKTMGRTFSAPYVHGSPAFFKMQCLYEN